MKTISLDYLNGRGACPEHVALFQDTFGDVAIPVNAKTVKKAKKAGLEIHWLTTTLSKTARAKYEKVADAAYAKYDKVREAAWVKCERVRPTASAKYQKVLNTAWAKHEKVRDAALIRIWNADEA